MTTMKAFTKGQAVTFFQSWDDKGTVRVVDLVVYSCGMKRMVLVDEAGVKFEGRDFAAQQVQGTRYNGHDMEEAFAIVLPRMTREAADVQALSMGAAVVACERSRMLERIAFYGHPETDGFNISVRESIARLHEPRVHRDE